MANITFVSPVQEFVVNLDNGSVGRRIGVIKKDSHGKFTFNLEAANELDEFNLAAIYQKVAELNKSQITTKQWEAIKNAMKGVPYA